MQITKFGHSCVLLSDGQTKILFDPGIFATVPDCQPDAIIITHTHTDHLEPEKIQTLLASKPARIITNSEVKLELDKNGIACEVVEDGAETTVGTINIAARGNDHAIIHPNFPKVQNTGYLINSQIFHPGDSLVVPPEKVDVLLLPIIAPWSKISETFDYISSVKAKINFPIHDGFLKDGLVFYRMAKMWCDNNNLEFIEPELDKVYDLI
jgi:L-ascorbate metabolism protein UlaG (beta-lactamase superfamily)